MDADLLHEFVEEGLEHLSDVETQLLQIEAMAENIDDDLVNTVFRAIHSVKGAAGFLGLSQINQVSHRLENVLGKIRDHKLIPDPYNVDILLKGADRLRSLIEEVDSSNDTDNEELCKALDEVLAQCEAGAGAAAPAAEDPAESSNPTDEVSGRVEGELDKVEEAVEEAVAPAEDQPAPKADEAPANPAPPKPAAASPPAPAKTPKKESKESQGSGPEATIRVSVRVLDQLMNLAGELVLSRNQLLRVLGTEKIGSTNLDSIASGLDRVTTELQETIMQTRMQPIGNVFNKFPRVTRDLSSTLGKKIDLKMEGNEVETDKTIVEAIADPLTHLVRNSCDHGIEDPAARASAGKPEAGTVVLKAFHQAGKVMIEIIDDGAGMDPDKLRNKAIEKGVITPEVAEQLSDHEAVNLIFAPGFSTAEAVTDVSGRGVGMDVVRTNIEKIGGTVEVESKLGFGSTIRITLPLTLAIVPSMIVSVNDRAYALPQANIVELVQTGGTEKRIERVSNAEVLRLRGSLMPLIRLNEALGIESDIDSSERDQQLVVVETGRMRFALAVDRVLDSEEIVVKPLGRHLSSMPLLAGSTILGDGSVALILDAAGVAAHMAVSGEGETKKADDVETTTEVKHSDLQRLVLLSVSEDDHFGVSMDIVSRIERVSVDKIDHVGDRAVLQYRGGTLPLVRIDEAISVSACDEPESVHIVVFKVSDHEVGLITPHLDDICDCDLRFSDDACGQEGVAGVTVIDGRTTRILDLYSLIDVARPEWGERSASKMCVTEESQPLKILICEDSPFFRNLLCKTLLDEGHELTPCENGLLGFETLMERPDEFDLLLTDVEMPELDGIELTKRVRSDQRFDSLPIIALTSLADDASVRRGIEAGCSDYQVKMNKPDLLASIARLTRKGAKV